MPSHEPPTVGPSRQTSQPGTTIAHHRRYHFHFPGVLFVAVTIFIAVGAINSQNNLLFAALGLAIGALLVSGVISGSSLMGLRLSRTSMSLARVGEPLTITYHLENKSRLVPAFAIHLHELNPEPVNLLPTHPLRTFVPYIEPRGSAVASIVLTPRARGQLRLSSLRASSTFPFGITKKSVAINSPDEVLVLPAVLPLKPSLIAEVVRPASAGATRTNVPGLGEEFFGVREYVPGDSPRRLSWRITARTGTMVVRQDTSPAPHRLWIVLRDHADAAPEQFERAVALAASLIAQAQRRNVAVGLIAPRGLRRPPSTSLAHHARLLRDLAHTQRADSGTADPEPSIPAKDNAITIHAGSVVSGESAKHLSGEQLAALVVPSPQSAPALEALGITRGGT